MNKRIIRILAVRLMFFITINFYYWTFVAIDNGKEVTVYFDHFGEASFEFAMYLVLFPIIVYGFYLELKENHKKKEKLTYISWLISKLKELKCMGKSLKAVSPLIISFILIVLSPTILIGYNVVLGIVCLVFSIIVFSTYLYYKLEVG